MSANQQGVDAPRSMIANYVPPAHIDECRERIAVLTGEIAMINADLLQSAEQAGRTPADHRDWKWRARRALAHKRAELETLKAWRAAYEQQRQAAGLAAREQREQERGQEHAAREQRREQQRGALEGADALVLNLYGALTRLYRKSKYPVTDQDKALMDTAHEYLLSTGVFEE